MANLFPSLDNNKMKEFLGPFPDSFDAVNVLGIFVATNERAWLVSLVGSTFLDSFKQAVVASLVTVGPTPLTDTQTLYLNEIQAFLTYAAYADYISTGGYQLTRSGPVRKIATREAEPLTKEERDALQRLYHSYAKQHALNISTLHARVNAPADTCKPGTGIGSGKPTAAIIRTPTRSRFSRS